MRLIVIQRQILQRLGFQEQPNVSATLTEQDRRSWGDFYKRQVSCGAELWFLDAHPRALFGCEIHVRKQILTMTTTSVHAVVHGKPLILN